MNLAAHLKFCKATNDFQKKMKKELNKLQKSSKTLTLAYKTTKIYRMSEDEYNRLKMSAITSTCKKRNEK